MMPMWGDSQVQAFFCTDSPARPSWTIHEFNYYSTQCKARFALAAFSRPAAFLSDAARVEWGERQTTIGHAQRGHSEVSHASVRTKGRISPLPRNYLACVIWGIITDENVISLISVIESRGTLQVAYNAWNYFKVGVTPLAPRRGKGFALETADRGTAWLVPVQASIQNRLP